MQKNKTIYALASGQGVGGVAVLRLSGPHCAAAVGALTRRAVPAARRTALRRLYDPESGALLDEALVLFFEGPASFTGEDCAELHVHGGRAVIDSVLSALSRLEGLRLAQAGEFTRRAFENGRMDLTSAEAVADLVHAQTQMQQQQALSQMGGALAALYEGWRHKLARFLAYAEAELDFPDEDLPESLVVRLRPEIEKIMAEIADHLGDARRGERIREGIQVAIIGAPNAGKSSLLNALARRDVAIVNDLAGTTRDVLEVALNLSGYPVLLYDTAGLRERAGDLDAHGVIEAEGIRRAIERARDADITLLVFDGVLLPLLDAETLAMRDERSIVLFNKADCIVDRSIPNGVAGHFVSAKTGEGLEEILSRLCGRLEAVFAPRENVSLTRARHRNALEGCLTALQALCGGGLPDELLAEELRRCVASLGRITGRVDVEDLLDIIFRDFCIGK